MRAVLVLLLVALGALALVAGTAIVGSRPSSQNGPNDGPSALPAIAFLPTDCSASSPLKNGDIATVAGTGIPGHSGDGGQARAAAIEGFQATVAVDAAGAVYITDPSGRTIRRIGSDGVISHYVDSPSFVGRSFPMGLAFDQPGDLYVADPGANLGAFATTFIWRVDPSGTVSPVAGKGIFGSTGNEGPALDAQIQAAQIAVGPRGDLYFDDNNGFRTIDTSGVIHAFAGTGVAGFSGDRGPAVDATMGLKEPGWLGVAVDTAGNVYLGDPGNYRLRKVDAAGIITTVAGTGVAGYSGDGHPAVEATMRQISGLAVDPAGDVFIADTSNNAVRRIDTAGVITTVAGTGVAGFLGDCGPAVSAQLDHPSALAVHDGILYIVDAGNERVRMVVP